MCNCSCSTQITSSVGPKGDTGPAGSASSASVIHVTDQGSSNLTLNGTTDSGSTIYLDRAAGVSTGLPTTPANGTYYDFVVKTAVTSNDYRVTAGGSDLLGGSLFAGKSATAPAIFLPVGGSDNYITMNGTTTGGLVGTSFRMVYVASAALWMVTGSTYGSGSLATSFSH